MRQYSKLTDANLQTRGLQWTPGEWQEVEWRGKLCEAGVVHIYDHPLLAALFRSIHCDEYSRLFTCEWEGRSVTDGTKRGVERCRLMEEIPLPVLSQEQLQQIAYRCADRAVRRDAPVVLEAAELVEEAQKLRTLAPIDDEQTARAACVIADAAYIAARAAANAAADAAYTAARAAVRATYAAYAAAYAADAAAYAAAATAARAADAAAYVAAATAAATAARAADAARAAAYADSYSDWLIAQLLEITGETNE